MSRQAGRGRSATAQAGRQGERWAWRGVRRSATERGEGARGRWRPRWRRAWMGVGGSGRAVAAGRINRRGAVWLFVMKFPRPPQPPYPLQSFGRNARVQAHARCGTTSPSSRHASLASRLHLLSVPPSRCIRWAGRTVVQHHSAPRKELLLTSAQRKAQALSLVDLQISKHAPKCEEGVEEPGKQAPRTLDRLDPALRW